MIHYRQKRSRRKRTMNPELRAAQDWVVYRENLNIFREGTLEAQRYDTAFERAKLEKPFCGHPDHNP